MVATVDVLRELNVNHSHILNNYFQVCYIFYFHDVICFCSILLFVVVESINIPVFVFYSIHFIHISVTGYCWHTGRMAHWPPSVTRSYEVCVYGTEELLTTLASKCPYCSNSSLTVCWGYGGLLWGNVIIMQFYSKVISLQILLVILLHFSYCF